MSGGAALTSTVWDNWPTFRVRLRACWAPTVRVISFLDKSLESLGGHPHFIASGEKVWRGVEAVPRWL